MAGPSAVPATTQPSTQFGGLTDTLIPANDKGKGCSLPGPYINEVPAGVYHSRKTLTGTPSLIMMINSMTQITLPMMCMHIHLTQLHAYVQSFQRLHQLGTLGVLKKGGGSLQYSALK